MASRLASRRFSGFSMIELLVVVSIIGVLMGLLLVALQASREAASRLGCVNNLRQIGIGLHSYHNLGGRFPPGAVEPRPLWRHGRQLAWSAFLLPHVEMYSLADKIDFQLPFDHPANRLAAATVLPLYLCPSTARSTALHKGRGACDYGGIFGERINSPNDPPKGVMLFDRGVSLQEIRDGASNTLVISEDSEFPDGEWINGRNVFDQAFQINHAPRFENDIRSRHPHGANGLLGDGSVRFLSETMELRVLGAICTRDRREPFAWVGR